MGFVVKDLMITVLPETGNHSDRGEAAEIRAGTRHCSGACCLTHCSYPSCAHRSCVISRVRSGPDVMEYDPTDLALLKEKLKLELAEIEAHEESSRRRMRPRTVEEVNAAESQLKSALKELQTIRSELEGKKS